MKPKIKKVVIIIFGQTQESLAEAAEHAAGQLKLGTKSEFVGWDDLSHVTFDVQNDATAEYFDLFPEDEE